MNLVAVVGSPRKGRVTDTLVDKAIEGFLTQAPGAAVRKINLIDHDIRHCKNCLTCRDARTDAPFAQCMIRDDMDLIVPLLLQSDALILATPVHMGSATALMVSFLERIVWVFAKPERTFLNIPGFDFLNVKGCPLPRSSRQRKAIVIVASGTVPPAWSRFCNEAAPLISGTIKDALNARTVGNMYAGAVEFRGIERYLGKAHDLGKKLGNAMRQ